MGVDGQRLTAAEVAAKQYSVSVDDKFVIITIPVGALGGSSKVSGADVWFDN